MITMRLVKNNVVKILYMESQFFMDCIELYVEFLFVVLWSGERGGAGVMGLVWNMRLGKVSVDERNLIRFSRISERFPSHLNDIQDR